MIYAVNSKTRQHMVIGKDCDDPLLTAHRELMRLGWPWFAVHADADGWIECDGEHRPIDANQEIQWKGSNGFVSGVIPANCVFWGENGADKIIAYRPILNAEEKEMKREWSGEGFPPVGAVCEWSDCGRPHKRALVMGYYADSVWLRVFNSEADGDFFPITVHCNIDAFRSIRTDRDRWIEAASIAAHKDAQLSPSQARIAAEYIYDAGLAKLPEQTK